MTNPTYDLVEYRFELDDGDENNATFAAALNTPISIPVGTDYKRRIRIQLFNDNGKNGNITVVWERNNTTQGTGWADVTTSSTHIQAVASDNAGVVEEDTLTNRLTNRGANFDGDGSITEDGTGASYTHQADQYAEHSLVFNVAFPADAGDNIEIRARLSGGETVTYSNTPSLAVATIDSDNQIAYIHGGDTDSDSIPAFVEGVTGTMRRTSQSAYIDGFVPAGLYQRGFRFRPEGANEAANSTTWEAAENTNVTLDMLPQWGGLLSRLRVEVGAYDNQGSITPRIEYRKNGGAWTVPRDWNYEDPSAETGTHDELMITNKSSYTDGAATTDLLTSASEGFTAGTHEYNGTAAAVTLDTAHTEIEWQFLISLTSETRQVLSEGDEFEFRVTNNGTEFGTYDSFPKVTINVPPRYIGATGVETNGDRVVLATPSGTLYAPFEDCELAANIMMLKSTDGGDTWTALDTAEALPQGDMESWSMAYDDTNKVIHCVHVGSTAEYYQFGTEDHATSADQWITGNFFQLNASIDSINQSASLVVRGTNVYAFYADLNTTDQVFYRKKSDLTTGSWGSETSIDTTGGTTDFSGVSTALGPNSNKIHIFYSDYSNFVLYHRTLDASDVLGTIHTVESDFENPPDGQHGMTNAVAWYDGTTEKAMIAYTDETNHYLWSVIVEDDGTPNSRQNASNSVVVFRNPNGINSRQPVATLAIYENVVWCLFADDATQDMWRTANNNGGGWAAPYEILDGEDTHSVQGLIFRHSTANGGDLVLGWVRDQPIEPGTILPGDAGLTGSNTYEEEIIGSSDSLFAYIDGAAAGTPDSDSQLAFVQGQDTASDNQAAFIQGQDAASDSQPAYMVGSATDSDNQSAFLQGQDTASDSQPAYMAGSLAASDSQPAYMVGNATDSDNQPAFLQGQDTDLDNQPAYILGGVNVSDNQPAYISGEASGIIIVEEIVEGGIGTSGTSFTVTAPSTVNNNDLFVLFIGCDGTPTVSENTTTDWTELAQDQETTTGSACAVFYHICDGTEDSETWTFDLSASETAVYELIRLSNWHGTTAPEISASEKASTGNADPPSLTASWGAENENLFIAGCGINSVTLTSGPSGYSNFSELDSDTLGGSGSCSVGVATKSVNAATDNPGTFSPGQSHVSYTVVVRPVETGTQTSDSKFAYIAGQDTTSDSQPVFIQGQDTAIDSMPAYVAGSLDTSNSQPAFIQGQDTASDNQVAFLQGQDTTSDNQSAYVEGIDGADNSQPAYMVGQDTDLDSKSAYVLGGVNEVDNQTAFIQGQDTAADSSPAYVIGEATDLDNQATYILGIDGSSDNQSAYISGAINVTDNQAAFVQGRDTAADNQSAYVNGVAGASDNQAAFVQGRDSTSDNQDAYILGGINEVDNQAAFIQGQDTASSNQAAYINGLSDYELSELPAFIQGQDTATDNQPTYIAGGVNVSDSQAAFVQGEDTTSDSQPAYITGASTEELSNVSAYISGKDTASDNQSAYMAGSISVSDAQPAYLAGVDTASSNQAAYISGLSDYELSELPAFILGEDTATDSQLAYLSGGINEVDNQAAYISGEATDSDNQPAFVLAQDTAQDNLSAYIVGELSANDSLSAYMAGSVPAASSLAAYMAGVDTASSQQLAFIEGGVVERTSTGAFISGEATGGGRPTFKGMWRGTRKGMM